MAKKKAYQSDNTILDNSDFADEDELYNDNNEEDVAGKPARLPRRDIIRICIFVIALVLFIFSAASLIKIFSEYQKGLDIYESIHAAVFINESTSMVPEGSIAETSTYADVTYAELDSEDKLNLENVDIEAIKAINSDGIAWIQIPAITRSYPVAHTDNNSYYLNHTFTREENNAGCIFIDARNYADFSDKNTIIYGHNMKNGTMFGMLNRFENQEFYNENDSHFYITTSLGIRVYQIFAVCLVPSDSMVYEIDFTGDITYENFLSYVTKSRLYSTGVTVLPTDSVVTLSTCTSDSKTRRVVLGKFIGIVNTSEQ